MIPTSQRVPGFRLTPAGHVLKSPRKSANDLYPFVSLPFVRKDISRIFLLWNGFMVQVRKVSTILDCEPAEVLVRYQVLKFHVAVERTKQWPVRSMSNPLPKLVLHAPAEGRGWA